MGYNLVLGKVNKLPCILKKAAVRSKCHAGYPFQTVLLNRVVDLCFRLEKLRKVAADTYLAVGNCTVGQYVFMCIGGVALEGGDFFGWIL